MMGQLSLFGTRPHRPIPAGEPIYAAALPGAQLTSALPPLIERLRTDFGVAAHSKPQERRHVSVLGIGIAHQMSADDVETAIRVTQNFVVAPFDLAFTTVMSYRRGPSGRSAPIVLVPDRETIQVPELAALLAQAMIAEALDPRGALGGGPHMTLLYDAAWVPPTPLPDPIVVRIERVALVQSHWGQGRYTILAETPAVTGSD
jgi:2'-5' RNA ligase